MRTLNIVVVLMENYGPSTYHASLLTQTISQILIKGDVNVELFYRLKDFRSTCCRHRPNG